MKILKTKAIVELTPAEIAWATDAGIIRNLENRKVGNVSVIVHSTSLKADIQGARAEFAVSKYFDIPWTGRAFNMEDWKTWRASGGHDVGPLEVRSTIKRRTNFHVPMFKTDFPDAPYVFSVIHSEHRYEIVGWCYGKTGMNPDFWDDPAGFGKPYYCVPMEVLRPIGELEMLLEKGVIK